MLLHYTLTQDAFIDYNIYYALQPAQLKRHSKWRVLTPVIWCSLSLAALIASYALDYPNVTRAASVALCLAAFASALWYFLYPAVFRKSLVKAIKRWFGDGKYNEYCGDYALEVTDEGLRETGSNRIIEAGYDKIENIVEDKRWIYIFIGSVTAFIIPLDAFADHKDMEGFLEFVKDKKSLARKS